MIADPDFQAMRRVGTCRFIQAQGSAALKGGRCRVLVREEEVRESKEPLSSQPGRQPQKAPRPAQHP